MQIIKSTILIATSDSQVRKMLSMSLNAAGYRFTVANGGKEAVRLTSCVRPNLAIIDSQLVDIEMLEVVKRIREISTVPIITMSDHGDDEEEIAAFDLGVDDFVIKPFNIGVLVSRINAALRRVVLQESKDVCLELGDITVDLMKHEVKVKGQIVPLSPKEYNLLAYLIQNRGKMLTHTQILNKIWGPSHSYDTQYLRVYIGQLRKKIDLGADSKSRIITEAGIGYRIESNQSYTSLAAH